YTLLLAGETNQAILPAIDPAFPFDAARDFVPISMVAEYEQLLVANARLPVTSPKELIAYAKQHPGELTFGSGGLGTVAHVAMEILMRRTGTAMVHVPYKGSNATMVDLLGGTLNLNVQSYPALLSNVTNPQVKVLSVLSSKRMDSL